MSANPDDWLECIVTRVVANPFAPDVYSINFFPVDGPRALIEGIYSGDLLSPGMKVFWNPTTNKLFASPKVVLCFNQNKKSPWTAISHGLPAG